MRKRARTRVLIELKLLMGEKFILKYLFLSGMSKDNDLHLINLRDYLMEEMREIVNDISRRFIPGNYYWNNYFRVQLHQIPLLYSAFERDDLVKTFSAENLPRLEQGMVNAVSTSHKYFNGTLSTSFPLHDTVNHIMIAKSFGSATLAAEYVLHEDEKTKLIYEGVMNPLFDLLERALGRKELDDGASLNRFLQELEQERLEYIELRNTLSRRFFAMKEYDFRSAQS